MKDAILAGILLLIITIAGILFYLIYNAIKTRVKRNNQYIDDLNEWYYSSIEKEDPLGDGVVAYEIKETDQIERR